MRSSVADQFIYYTDTDLYTDPEPALFVIYRSTSDLDPDLGYFMTQKLIYLNLFLNFSN
jgi:hypothetical protein